MNKSKKLKNNNNNDRDQYLTHRFLLLKFRNEKILENDHD